MRKESVCKFVSALLLLCLLCGCANEPKGVGAVPVSSSHKLTREQMLADYDAMWKDIDENYPLMGVAERTTGKDFAKIKADYRKKVLNAGSDLGFFYILNNCIKEFQGTGHMCLLYKDRYTMVMSIYKNIKSPHCNYLYRILDNAASRDFYSYTPVDIYAKAKETASTKGKSGNISTKIYEKDKVCYLEINSFGSQFVSVDAPKIEEFFRQAKDSRYCILDICGNGGGAEAYWMDNIVSPNLDRDASYVSYELIKGEAAKQYLSIMEKLHPISELKKLPNTDEKDLAQMKYFTETQKTVKSKDGKKAFSGKFYLLTDGVVYSSAEGFAMFCKQSGFAKIVGEPTDGDGGGIDPLLFVLPNSGIVLRFSASLGLNQDGSSNEEFGTQPDVPCAKGKDALQTCLDLIQAGQ
ncbi:MAG TPA: S41 family peptidase [Caproiciproducens sp.]|nr:S41 family peptidase [Caproiciproducens sp.]